MATVHRPTRVASDADIIRLNRAGISLAAIAARYGCHPTSITLRLKALGIPPTDTRRAFMENVFAALEPEVQEWLLDQLTDEFTMKDFTTEMIKYIHSIHQGTP